MEEQLAKYFSGESTQDEMEQILTWRNESSDNAKAFMEAKNLWLVSEEAPEADDDILKDILKEENKKAIFLNQTWFRYAAAAMLVIGVGVILFLMSGQTKTGIQKLADGSEVFLHGGSKLTTVSLSEDLREVTLDGKAYFDIKRDENRPFIVNTSNARIEVLGTSFVISSYDKKTEVCVESGLVSLVKPGELGSPDLSVKLSKGEMGTVTSTNKGILKRNNNNPNYLAWKTKTLVFDHSKMADVELTLEDAYGIQVEFENPDLKDCNLTAKFKERKAKDAIEIIARTFNLSYEFRDDKVIIKGKGC